MSFSDEISENLLTRTVDEGFDVWIISTRGTTYSNEHEFLDPQSREYWSFSFSEIGSQDIKAAVDVIYNDNGQRKIYLIGQSNGTTANHYAMSTPLEEEFFAERVHKVI